MTNTPAEQTTANSVQRGIPILLIVVGVFALRTKGEPGAPLADFVAGVIAIVFAGALFLKLRLARWLALGACFLAIVGACTLPALLFVRDPLRSFDPYASTAFTNALLSVFGFAFGGLGYKGLKYYRSDLARVEHYPRSMRPQDITPEHSKAVLLSAIVWAGLFALGGVAGMSMPRWLFNVALHRAQPQPARVPKPTFLRVPAASSDSPAASDSDAAAPPAAPDLPDLIPMDLCLQGPDVAVAYINAGTSTMERFRLAATENGYERSSQRFDTFRVPNPGELAFAKIAQAHSVVMSPGTDARFTVTLDADNQIAESDESDNTRAFPVFRGRDGKLDLRPCDQLQLIS